MNTELKRDEIIFLPLNRRDFLDIMGAVMYKMINTETRIRRKQNAFQEVKSYERKDLENLEKLVKKLNDFSEANHII
jgi:hypothetical protein